MHARFETTLRHGEMTARIGQVEHQLDRGIAGQFVEARILARRPATRELVEILLVPVMDAGQIQIRVVAQGLGVELGDIAAADKSDVHACGRSGFFGPAAA